MKNAPNQRESNHDGDIAGDARSNELRHQRVKRTEQDNQPKHREDGVEDGLRDRQPRAGQGVGGRPPVFLGGDPAGKPVRNVLAVGGYRGGLTVHQ